MRSVVLPLGFDCAPFSRHCHQQPLLVFVTHVLPIGTDCEKSGCNWTFFVDFRFTVFDRGAGGRIKEVDRVFWELQSDCESILEVCPILDSNRILLHINRHVQRQLVLQNKALLGSVNSNVRHYQRARNTLTEYPDWFLPSIMTTQCSVSEFVDAFEDAPDSIKSHVDFSV